VISPNLEKWVARASLSVAQARPPTKQRYSTSEEPIELIGDREGIRGKDEGGYFSQ